MTKKILHKTETQNGPLRPDGPPPPDGTPESIEALIAIVGTSAKFAAALGLRVSCSVDNWKRRGIPRKHWAKIAELCNLTEYQIFLVDKNCRAEVRASMAA